MVPYLEFFANIKPLCISIFPHKKALNYCNMSRLMSVPSDFCAFEPNSPVCGCLCWFEEPDIEILGTSGNFKRQPFICVKPRQPNSGVYRCQILCRIRFHRSRRRNLPQFRGLEWFGEANRGFIRHDILTENAPPAKVAGAKEMEETKAGTY